MKSMIKLSVCSLAVVMFSCAANASSHKDVDGSTCAAKKQAIENQISYAEKHNDILRTQGLKKALSDVSSHCTDSDLESKYKEKIKEKSDKVAERMKDLKEAQLKGDAEKIAKQEAKLLKDKAELTQAEAKLNEFYKALKK